MRLIITIAFGSTLATVILNKNIALADGVLAFFLLIFLQFIITYLSVRVQYINHLVKSTPSLLAYKGEMLKETMQKERLLEDELYAEIRKKGLSSLNDVEAIVLETGGSISVIEKRTELQSKIFKSVQKPAEVA